MLNRLRYSILLLTIIFTHFTDAAAQGTSKHKAKITGIVTDENHDPIELATVRIEKPVLVGTTTDLRGHYSISVDTQDSVTVIFSMIGYRTKKKTLRRPKGIIALNVTMLPSDVELEGVTVSEVRRQTTSTQKLDIKDQKLMPDASGGSVESYIATQAGVSSNNELSSQYNVRGGSFDENSVYINGIEVYRPMLISSGQQEGLSIINPDMVSDIGFSSGGFEAKYGDKMSSVLDITYKKVKKFEGSANLSMLGGGIYAGFGNKHFSMTQSVRYKTNRYLLGTLDTKGEYNPNFIDYQNYTS
ncbi:MAG: carboxypeptidase-like regulatory domain-containing protein, partial [Bacteroidaceae bacterium]|nr:carboxypeptidase-like regulatory domain-containing protein [Bacteroidaceae bacterium]